MSADAPPPTAEQRATWDAKAIEAMARRMPGDDLSNEAAWLIEGTLSSVIRRLIAQVDALAAQNGALAEALENVLDIIDTFHAGDPRHGDNTIDEIKKARALLSGQPVDTEVERLETALYEISEAAGQPEGYYTDETEAVLNEVLPKVQARAALSSEAGERSRG